MDELSGAMGAIWARNLEAQERRVAAQEQAIVALLAGTLTAASREEAALEAHKLAGSLGSFGLAEGSTLADELQAAWSSPTASPPDAAHLAQVVATLRRLMREHTPIETEAPLQGIDLSAPGYPVDILLVDDDDVFADFVCAALESQSKQVTWMPDGESARDAVCGPDASIRPRVVLLDVEMPGLDGFGLLEELARNGVTRHATVIMLTRRTMAEDVVRARKLGIFDYLAKPLDAPMLIDRVSRALAALPPAS
jgi:CheY-like chemotaxis protein/HPt (histidine-containing phosphotransfer) domain-containing protein